MTTSMTRTRLVAAMLLIPAAVLFSPGPVRAQTSASAALAGRVSSQEEGPMEGVLVSAKREGSTVTITVASDAQGRYSFPQKRLEPGRYAVRIRAAGYELDGAGSVEITAGKAAQLDLKLRKVQDVSSQLSNAEWLWSAPGTEEQKKPLLNCIGCHTLERTFRSHHTAAEWAKVVERMESYDSGSQPERPQAPPHQAELPPRLRGAPAKFADYLASIDLSSVSQWQFPLKTLPRPKGKATRVIITEYDVPHKLAMPHDAVPDSQGFIWYADFGQQYIARLDPKTAQVVEYASPVPKPDYPTGNRTVRFDAEGNVWVSMQEQGAAGKFDRKTQKFQIWSVPMGKPEDGSPRVSGMLAPVNGKLWVQAPRGPQGRTAEWMIQRLDIRTGEWEQPVNVYRDAAKNPAMANHKHSVYDIVDDSQGNIYFMDYGSEFVGKMDAKTGKLTYYQTPTPDSGPRRGHVDKQDRVWFGENRGFAFGMFDPKTERFQEWKIPTPFFEAYDAILGNDGYAWAGGETSDRVARLNEKTGEIVEYLLPRPTNIRRVDVDNSTKPSTLWVGSNHGASIVKVEALEP
jgi:streptogramin lyase